MIDYRWKTSQLSDRLDVFKHDLREFFLFSGRLFAAKSVGYVQILLGNRIRTLHNCFIRGLQNLEYMDQTVYQTIPTYWISAYAPFQEYKI